MENKNIKENIEKIVLFILVFITILSIIIQKPINDLDELWNYNFARNIADGLVPYKDFSIIVTPLLSIISGLILKITFNQLIVMRVLAALLSTGIIYVVYKLFLLLNIKKEIALIFTFFIGYLFENGFCIDYNYATLLLTLTIIYIEVTLYKKDNNLIKVKPKADLILGFLAGLSILTKQTSGLCICLAALGNKFLFVRKKEEFLLCLKSFAYRLIGGIIPVAIFLTYLFCNNAFEEFVNYTILGVTEFTNTQSYLGLIKFDFVGILSILVPITFVYTWIKCVTLEKCDSEYILVIYGLAIFVICFPISNKIHFLIGALPIIILILYKLNKFILLIKNKLLKNEKVIDIFAKILKFAIVLFLICYSAINFYNYLKVSEDYCKMNHFKYIPISDRWERIQKKLYDYITENGDVKVLDALAVISMIPADRYNKDYDMFNIGNFGYNGENRLIEEISNSKDTKYLVVKQTVTRKLANTIKYNKLCKRKQTKNRRI